MWPVSPTVRRPTRTSPLTTPSICSSPSPVTPPSMVRSADSREATFGGARRAGSTGGRAIGVGSGSMRAEVLDDLACLLNILTSLQETIGVLSLTVDPDFVVQVRTGRAAGRAHGGDPVADRHALADANADGGQVGVAGLEAV